MVTFTNGTIFGILQVDGNISAPRVDLETVAAITGIGTLTITGTGSLWSGGHSDRRRHNEDCCRSRSDVDRRCEPQIPAGNRIIQNEGTLIEGTTNSDIVELDGAAVLNNVGVFDIRNNQIWENFAAPAGTLTFINSGTLKKTAGTGTFTLTQTTLNNTGRIDGQTGRIAFGGGGVSTGVFNTAAGASIAFIAGTENLADRRDRDGSRSDRGDVYQRGDLWNHCRSMATSVRRALTLRLWLRYQAIGTLTITGMGSLWSGGTLTGGGTTKIAAGGDLTIAGVNRKFLGNRIIQNEGTLIEGTTNSDIVELDGTAVLNNVGVFDIRNDRIWENFSAPTGTLTLNNTGTLKKTAGALEPFTFDKYAVQQQRCRGGPDRNTGD